ncbi:uncharacterized protein PAC_17149 [Phialocephala subalpina]|uniref:PHD-type domain-containing protein n=1 Tax=Phialocephala subalpina TaxID=576137 RepID=A0A1L7XQE1_9HELO|nr:uncharacterized protein PAC_17149 [Phialocephala subalpina]
MARSRRTRGVLDPVRRAARIELVKVPKSMDDCTFNLQVVPKSQLHRDLVLAIVQFTGYTKTFPNTNGQIAPRAVNGVEFTIQFLAIVDTFLTLAGAKFFPPLIPEDAGWQPVEENFMDFEGMPRLVWAPENFEEKEDIKVNMQLLFETIRNNGLVLGSSGQSLSLEKANLFKCFDTKDCYVCGSQTETHDNILVQCKECKCNWHQQCYAVAIIPIPVGHGWWYCKTCIESKKEKENVPRDEGHSQRPFKKRKSESYRRKSSIASTAARFDSVPPFEGHSESTPSVANDTPTLSPVPSILPRDCDYLMVIARQKATNVYKSINISDIRSVEDFFNACGLIWGMEVENLYVYLPDSDGLLEVIAGNRDSFKDVMRLFPRGRDNDKTVLMKVLVIAQGEVV